MGRKLEDYRALPYTRRAEGVQEEADRPYWVAWIEELPGCKTDGETYAEAMANLDAAFDDYVEAKLEWGADIPLPARVPQPWPESAPRVYLASAAAATLQARSRPLESDTQARGPSQNMRFGMDPGEAVPGEEPTDANTLEAAVA